MAVKGRPPKPKYGIAFMLNKIAEYTDDTPLPILKECCFKNNWNYDYIMQLQRKHPDLSQSIKRLLMKKEVVLELGMLSGKLPAAAAIFSLKQMGWSDRNDLVNVVKHDDDELTKSLEDIARAL